MRRFGLKAIFALLSISRPEAFRPDWDRIVIIGSTAVTVGLAAVYAYGKATSRW